MTTFCSFTGEDLFAEDSFGAFFLSAMSRLERLTGVSLIAMAGRVVDLLDVSRFVGAALAEVFLADVVDDVFIGVLVFFALLLASVDRLGAEAFTGERCFFEAESRVFFRVYLIESLALEILLAEADLPRATGVEERPF